MYIITKGNETVTLTKEQYFTLKYNKYTVAARQVAKELGTEAMRLLDTGLTKEEYDSIQVVQVEEGEDYPSPFNPII